MATRNARLDWLDDVPGDEDLPLFHLRRERFPLPAKLKLEGSFFKVEGGSLLFFLGQNSGNYVFLNSFLLGLLQFQVQLNLKSRS